MIQLPDGVRMENRFLQQIVASWMGLSGAGGAGDLAGIPLRQTAVSDDSLYAGAFRNRGSGGLHLNVLSSDGTKVLLRVTDAGVIASSGGSAATSPFALVGMIVAWHGSSGSVPAQWQICDGTNGTPDLRDRFIVGAGSTYALNATGGSATHNHTATTDLGGTAATGSAGTGNTGSGGTSPTDLGGTVATGGGDSGLPNGLRTVTDDGTNQHNVADFDHIHDGTSHTHSIGSHNHTGPSHSHTGPSHSHTLTTAAGSNLAPYAAMYWIKRIAA